MHSYFFIRINGQFLRIHYNEVLYMEADKNYTRIHTEKKSYMAFIILKEMDKTLPKQLFCRVHRSYIVSLNKITCFDHEGIMLEDKIHIPLGNYYRKILLDSVHTIMCNKNELKKFSEITLETLIEGTEN